MTRSPNADTRSLAVSGRTPPTLASCRFDLDLHKVRSQTWRILNAPADLTSLSDLDLTSLDNACTALWRDLDCGDLHRRVCVERSRRGLNASFEVVA